MWMRAPVRCSRHALDEAGRRGSRCTCHAKRYVPANRQRKAASGSAPRSGGVGRKPPTAPEPADPEDLLRELNSGGAGWLRDEEEQDWGLDDVADHARARQQKQLQRYGGAPPGGGGSAVAAARDSGVSVGGRRRGGGGDAAIQTHGSPLESGFASISSDGDVDLPAALNRPADAARSRSAAAAGSGAGDGDGGERTALDRRAAAGQGRTVVELEASYARRNPEIVEALRLRGVAVRVRQPAGGVDDDGDGDGFGDGAAAAAAGFDPDLDVDDFGLSDGDGDLDLRLDSDLALTEDGGSSSSGSGGGGGGQGAGPSGSRDWYGSLAAAGFSVRTNAAGEVFLERTVRRKADDSTATRAPSTSTAPAAPARGSVPVAAAAAAAAPGAVAAAATAAAAGPLVPPLEPIPGRPAVVAALQRLTTPQQVLDFLELSYSQWAANGYRLVDMRSGRPVTAPSPAEAAHCLRALAITARRAEIGGWRCLELAAGRQVQGLAEALRVTPPRLLPEQATPQLSAAYFDAARRFWLDPAAETIIDDPRVGRTRGSSRAPAAAAVASASAAPVTPSALAASGGEGAGAVNGGTASRRGGAEGDSMATASGATTTAAAEANDEEEEDGFSMRAVPSSSDDKVYDSLVAKYASISQHKQLLDDVARGVAQQQQPSGQRSQVLNGHSATAPAAAATAAPAGDKGRAGLPAEPSGAAPSPEAAAAKAAAEAAVRRAAKIECLVSALWGMSSLGGPPYFQAETEAAVTILVRCLASATAAAAAAPPSTAAAAGAAGAAATTGPGGLTGWQAGQVLWALGNSRHVTPRLTDLESSILRAGGLSAMQPRDVTRVLWGFASLGHRPERLLLTIRPDWAWRERAAGAAGLEAQEAQERASGGGGRQRRKGKAQRGKRAGSGGGDLRGDIRGFTPQQLAGAVWALAVMEQVDTGPFRSAWAQLLRRASEVPPAEAVLTQIWQANLALHLESSSASATASSPAGTTSVAAPVAASPASHHGRGGGGGAASRKGGVAVEDLTAAGLAAAATTASGGAGGGAGLDVAAARALLVRARDVFLSATSGLRRRVQSGYQRQMANSLTGLRLMHLLEDNSAGYSIDITLPQLRIALEADGPTHTSRTPGGAVLGATAMKRRHLQRLGWHVVNVTYKEWDKLTSEAARRAFLQERINDALLSNVQLSDDEEDGGAGVGTGQAGTGQRQGE